MPANNPKNITIPDQPLISKINTFMPQPFNTLLFSLSLVSLLLGSAFSTSILAASRDDETRIPWYEVEVIIFAHSNKQLIDSEKWPDTITSGKHEKIIDLRFADDPSFDDDSIPSFQDDITPQKPVSAADANSVSPAARTAQVPVALPWVFLEQDELKLRQMADKLRLSNDAEPILHIGWRQPTLDPKKSIPVFVYDSMTRRGADLANDSMMHDAIPEGGSIPVNEMSPNEQAGMSPEQRAPGYAVFGMTGEQGMADEFETGPLTAADMAGPNYHYLSGTLRLSVSRYLHIESDLKLRLPIVTEETYTGPEEGDATDMESGNGGGGFGSFFGVNKSAETVSWTEEHEVVQSFRLSESRRLRSKEIHFLDHPLFGVIIQVIPFEAYPVEEVIEEIVEDKVRSLL